MFYKAGNLITTQFCDYCQESCSSDKHSNYQLQLMKDALVSLRKIKEAEEYPKADMWCHFGTAVIRVPEEGKMY